MGYTSGEGTLFLAADAAVAGFWCLALFGDISLGFMACFTMFVGIVMHCCFDALRAAISLVLEF